MASNAEQNRTTTYIKKSNCKHEINKRITSYLKYVYIYSLQQQQKEIVKNQLQVESKTKLF